MRIQFRAIGLLLLLVASSARAADAVAPAADAKATAEQISQFVREMASADPYDAQAGLIKLAMLPPEAFPLIQSAAADKSLKGQAAEMLNHFVTLEAARQPARKRLADEERARYLWRRSTARAAYDKVGTKDPKWDALAQKAITLFTDPIFATVPGLQTIKRATKSAIASGCSDPLILYIDARVMMRYRDVTLARSNDQFQAASDAFATSNYPLWLKTECDLYAFCQQAKLLQSGTRGDPGQGTTRYNNLLKRIKAEWPDAMKQDVPPALIRRLATMVLELEAPAVRKARFDMFYEPWQQAAPDSPEVLTFKGDFYVTYAWDARSGDWAANVTDDQWKRFGERLAVAEEALTKAWEKDPHLPEAPTIMLKVELGQGRGRDVMEQWFKRAMEADPDNTTACGKKMLYLEPKWHGNPAEMIKFAHECFDGQNWRASIPFQLEIAYHSLRMYVADPATLYSTPTVWRDIERFYEPFLRALPDRSKVRGGYTAFACQAGKWDVAKKQFELLGNSPIDANRFGGPEMLRKYQATAQEKGR